MPDNPTGSAPGWPGCEARWTSSAKCAVGTALGPSGRVWFTISHGILNEVYYPRVDQACIRDLGLLVAGNDGFFSEEKRHATHQVESFADGIPAFRLTNTCVNKRYQIEKEVLADPQREVVLQRIRFTPLQGTLDDYSLFALLAPHLGNAGGGNNAFIGDLKGVPMLFAEREGTALAMVCSAGWTKRSAGFVGASDGWRDVSAHGQMLGNYQYASNGNIALTGQIDIANCGGEFVIALGFGKTHGEAGHRAAASLFDGFDRAASEYTRMWSSWQNTLLELSRPAANARDLYRVSTAVLRTHESARIPGGIIASLSIPWGASKGDGDLGGYHLAWPRDLVESAGGLLAAGDDDDVRRILNYLAVTQEADGRWPQNMWLDGTAYWNGIQLDEVGFPILLIDLAKRLGALHASDLAALWPTVRKAVGFLVRHGPVTEQDRWEENSGYSPFTLAVEIAALLSAAELADQFEPAIADYLRATADAWNDSIERWTYVSNTDLSNRVGVDGYYLRISPAHPSNGEALPNELLQIKNHVPGAGCYPANSIVSPDALALVRFGLRAANDPRILNTIKVIDAPGESAGETLLKVTTPAGPVWRRYNHDGYGEHEGGAPFDGAGIGRPWPLLTAERAHYEIAAGNKAFAEELLATLSRCANSGGLLPEQIWDENDVPGLGLHFGQASGSAMPLVWAHAEYVKLCRSLADGSVFDMPQQTRERYVTHNTISAHTLWRLNQQQAICSADKILRLEFLRPAMIHFSSDNWGTVIDVYTNDTELGVYIADILPEQFTASASVVFTILWTDTNQWEGTNYVVELR